MPQLRCPILALPVPDQMNTATQAPPPAQSKAKQPVPQSAGRALLWMGGALTCFSLVAISGRGASAAGVTTMQLMCYRSIVALVLVVLAMLATRPGLAQIRTSRIPMHGLRNGLHFIAQYSWFSALTMIPLAQLFALEFTAPLWVAILAPIFLAERLTAIRLLAATIGFAGVLTIVRPGTLVLDQGSIYALVAALGFAASMVATRTLMRTDTILCFLFHMSWSQALLAGALLWPELRTPTPEGLFWVVMVGVSGLAAHFSLARAFTYADAIIVAPMDFLRLPLIAFVGLLLYQEPLDPYVLAGGAIVVAGNLINLLGEHRRRARQRG